MTGITGIYLVYTFFVIFQVCMSQVYYGHMNLMVMYLGYTWYIPRIFNIWGFQMVTGVLRYT